MAYKLVSYERQNGLRINYGISKPVVLEASFKPSNIKGKNTTLGRVVTF